MEISPESKKKISTFEPKEWLKSHPYFTNEERYLKLESLVNSLLKAGLDRLCRNFFDQVEPERAKDILFEMWVAYGLISQKRGEFIKYEPPPNYPDFQFRFNDVTYNLEVKRVLNFEGSIDRDRVEILLSKEKSIKKNCWMSLELKPGFSKNHYKDFLKYLRENEMRFAPHLIACNKILPDYFWPLHGEPLACFSFYPSSSGKTRNVGQIIRNRSGLATDEFYDPVRKCVNNQLKKARTNFQELSNDNCNIVIIQPGDPLYLQHDDLLTVLYGSESIGHGRDPITGETFPITSRSSKGLFQDNTFSRIAAIILIDATIDPLSDNFTGTIYRHFRHKAHFKEWETLPFDGFNVVAASECLRGPFKMEF